MGKVIKVQPYADGVEASCKWNNRRLYVFYNHEVNTFIFGIKSYSNKKGVNSFCTVTSNRGIHAMEFALSLSLIHI